jgi:histidinol-phosphate aminotransferase
MSHTNLSRRQFARRIGAAAGAAWLAQHFTLEVQARQPRGAEGTIQLNANENPYGPSPKAREAMTRSQGIASRYPDALEDEAMEAIARHHGVSPENVVLGCGSGEILKMADMAFLSPEKNVVVAEPTFEAVLNYNRITRAEAIKVPLTADARHDLPAMAAACNARTGLVYVCNPNNPTGTIVTKDELAAFLPRVPKTAAILVDEAYHHFVEDPRYASAFEWFGPPRRMPNLIVVRTFSKIYGMAGMRLGYAVAPPELARAMRPHRVQNNSNAAVLEAAIASLADEPLVPNVRKQMNDTRRWLCRELEKDGRRYIPSETNFVMVDVGRDVGPLIGEFRKRKLLVGRKFPSLPNYLRISIGLPEEMQAFMAALREIVPAGSAKAA